MAKGKHAPAPGAVKKDKMIHPKSRQAARIQSKAQKRSKIQMKSGGDKLQAVGEKLNWFRENLQFCLPDDNKVDCAVLFTLAEAFLTRFEEELEQIKLKNSVGKNRTQHRSRLDTIEHVLKLEKDEFEGCGLEIPDLLDSKNLHYFLEWQGELKFVQNIKLKRFRKKDLQENKFDIKENDMEVN